MSHNIISLGEIADLLGITPYLRREEQKDAAQVADFEKEARRRRGVTFSGSAPLTPPRKRSHTERLQAARQALAKRQAFDASPRGRFLDALRGVNAAGYEYTAETCRKAYERGFSEASPTIVHAELVFAIHQLTSVGGDSAATKFARAGCEALLELAFAPTTQEAA